MEDRGVHGNSQNPNLVGTSIQQDRFTYPYYGGISGPNYLMSTSVIAGLRRNGRMSVVRRFFCLFVTFDLLFTCLLWLICLVLVGNFSFYSVFESEIVHYTIQKSLFDIVMAALVRFTSLLLFYALLHINHWIIVAITTSGSCAFLVAKVYFFNWGVSSQPVMQVLLILSSFVLAWAETWFLDLRVITQERLAREYFNVSNVDDPSPLLQRLLSSTSRFETFSDSVGSFYSPVESPEDSGDEYERLPRKRNRQNITNELILEYRRKGEDTLEKAWEILNNGKWVLDKDTIEGDKISKQKLGKDTIFYFVGNVNVSSSHLFELLWKDIEGVASWNPTIVESKILKVIDDSTDICYQLSADAGGAIKSRDFVILRHWQHKYGHIIISNVSVACPICPEKPEYIRGLNGPGCWVIKELPKEPNKSELHWVLNTNIRGWIPQNLVNSSLTGVMIRYISYLREHVSQLRLTS